ncbi:MAG: hypothetical protein VB078_02535 [Clostridiaceae bacterium]|nr:hypothetical protein [Clostridiaceae bacterium]
MRKSLKKPMSAFFALAMVMTSIYAAPLKEDEKSVLLYGVFIACGVIIYMGAGKLFDKFVKGRKKENKEK